MKNIKNWSAIVVVAVAIAGTFFWLGGRQTTQSSPAGNPTAPSSPGKTAAGAPPPTSVDAARVKTAPMAKTISAVGSLRSDETVILRPEVSGRISSIDFQEGRRVTKGTVIVRLDQAVQRAEMQQAEANLMLAKSRVDRLRGLHAQGFISSQALDDAYSGYKVSIAAADLAAARLTKLDIKAPFSGITGLRLVSVGDYVREGQDLVNIEDIDSLKVDFRIPELFLKQISVGQPLQIALDSFPNMGFVGRVLAINPLIDSNGRSIVIRALVKNADARLRPGMFARVKLVTNDQQVGLVIPEQALIPVGDDFFVFKIADDRALRTKIEIGSRSAGSVEVVRGLTNSDVVVIAGQPKLRDGGPVKIATMNDIAVPAPAVKSGDAIGASAKKL